MKFIVDLDGTIARANRAHQKRLINQIVKMGLRSEELDMLPWEAFLILPALVERFGGQDDPRRVRFLNTLPHMPENIVAALPIAGSLEALTHLAESGHMVSYATARQSQLQPGAIAITQAQVDEVNAVKRQSTEWWLRKHGYPNPDRVFYGGGDGVKLRYIADLLLAEEDMQVVFIDDAPHVFLKGSKKLLTKQQVDILRARCSIVVYGPQAEFVEQYGNFFQLVPLPSWNALDSLYERGILPYVGKTTIDTITRP